jgi:hypothetical protein
MNRCLSERVMLRIYTQEGTLAERGHLRVCADCAERYDAFEEDLQTIGAVLEAPPVAEVRHPLLSWRVRWLSAATAGLAMAAVVASVVWLRPPAPVQVAARSGNVTAFADDVSAALFASTEGDVTPRLAAEAPYLEAALEAGWPCTQARFLRGDCNDQLSALLIEEE